MKKFKDLLKNGEIPKSKFRQIDHDRLNEDKEDFLKLDKRKQLSINRFIMTVRQKN